MARSTSRTESDVRLRRRDHLAPRGRRPRVSPGAAAFGGFACLAIRLGCSTKNTSLRRPQLIGVPLPQSLIRNRASTPIQMKDGAASVCFSVGSEGMANA